jgi:hypothetical protein
MGDVIMRYLCIVAMLAIVVGGCTPAKAPEPPPQPQGPDGLAMTKQGVLDELRPQLAPMRACLQKDAEGISDATSNNILSAFRDAKLRYGARDYAQEAFSDIATDVADIARQARDMERWRLAMLCVDIHEILGMNSMELSRISERGRVVLAKPKVVVKGFMDDKATNTISVFVAVTDRQTQKVDQKVMREGDVDGNLRLVRIIGKNQTVRFEYTAIPGMYFDVEGIKWGS